MLRIATMALVCLSATHCFSPLGAAHRPHTSFRRSGSVIGDAQAVGRSVAEWCMASGRPEATIAVSPATNVIDAMHDFWLTARTFGGESGTPDRQRILAFPSWQKMLDAQTFPEVIQHIEGCSDICAHLGESLLIAGRHPAAAVSADEPPAPVPIIVLRSFRQEAFGDFSQENYGVEDPFAVLPDDDFINDDAGERGDTVSDEQCRSKAATHVAAIAKQLGSGVEGAVAQEGAVEFEVPKLWAHKQGEHLGFPWKFGKYWNAEHQRLKPFYGHASRR